jgi:hypothetical protein
MHTVQGPSGHALPGFVWRILVWISCITFLANVVSSIDLVLVNSLVGGGLSENNDHMSIGNNLGHTFLYKR